MSIFSISDSITVLPTVGPRYQQKLERIGITTIKDLLFHFPSRYEDTRNLITIDQLRKEAEGTILAEITQIGNVRTRSRLWLTKAVLKDGTGQIEAIWFNQPFLTKTLKQGQNYLFHGKTKSGYGGISLQNPQYEVAADSSDELIHLARLTPVYPETEGLTSKWLRSKVKLLKILIPEEIEEVYPSEIIEKHGLLSMAKAVEKIHFPQDEKDIEAAQKRLGVNELVEIQIKTEQFLAARKGKKSMEVGNGKITEDLGKFIETLPFKLTQAQETAINEILEDMAQDKPMNRLLNGDVGSGKTVVALAAAIACYHEGYSTIIMAPTTILAKQHYENIKKMLSTYDPKINIALTTSSQKIPNKSPQILVGTHAILFQDELPPQTALIVIDEQHRFGVNQRQQLNKLASGKFMPHYLTMTATPIPRTLTMALYGATNVSILDQMPAGRKPVKTHYVSADKRTAAYQWIEDQTTAGHQVFIICPLVEDSEKVEAKAATTEFTKLKKIFKKAKLGLIHGQLKEKEKNEILEDFKAHKFDILVATPVIEVGIDIPNASVMLIENAERFGLAQLHQFRGRVGRSDQQAYCFLFSESEDPIAIERLEFFAKNNSGFRVAEYDLKQRGPGEVYGLKQSGILKIRFADITDVKQMKLAQEIAHEIIKSQSAK